MKHLQMFLEKAGLVSTLEELVEYPDIRKNILEIVDTLIERTRDELNVVPEEVQVTKTVPDLLLYLRAKQELKQLADEQKVKTLDHMMIDYALWVGRITVDGGDVNVSPMSYIEEFIEMAYQPSKQLVRRFLEQWYSVCEILTFMDKIAWEDDE